MSPGNGRWRLAAPPIVGVVAVLAAAAAAAATPESRSAAVVVLRGSGSAQGGFTWTRHRDTGTTQKQRLIEDDTLVLQGTFQFTFDVDERGAVTGRGTGRYTNASWTFTGTRGGMAFSCSPAITTDPFSANIKGSMRAGAVALQLTLPDAKETSATTDCGAGFVVQGATAQRLNASLMQVSGRTGIDFSKQATRTLTDDADLADSKYDPFRARYEWTLTVKTPACPPSFDTQATREYNAGQADLARALALMDDAERAYLRAFQRTQKELRALRRLTSALGRGKAGPFWTRPEISRNWIGLDVLPALSTYERAVARAARSWRSAERRLGGSIAAAGKAKNLRAACEPDFRRVAFFAARRGKAIEKKRQLIASWGRVSLSMRSSLGPFGQAAAALASARSALPPASARAATPSAQQIAAARARLTRVVTLCRRALVLQDGPATAAGRLRRELLRAVRA